ncbi:unnamed protein product, partial [Phaeothamnion confervicola]
MQDCGRTKYFGDAWNSETKRCEYRKCADTCSNSDWTMEWEGNSYTRERHCCTSDYCNPAAR